MQSRLLFTRISLYFLKHIYIRHLHVTPKTFNAITHSLKCNLQSCLVKTVDMLLMKTVPVLIIQNLSQTLNRIAAVFCSILLLQHFHFDIFLFYTRDRGSQRLQQSDECSGPHRQYEFTSR